MFRGTSYYEFRIMKLNKSYDKKKNDGMELNCTYQNWFRLFNINLNKLHHESSFENRALCN